MKEGLLPQRRLRGHQQNRIHLKLVFLQLEGMTRVLLWLAEEEVYLKHGVRE